MSSKKKTLDASIAFFGTPAFAVYVLEALHEAGIVPDVIITAPDKPAGRGLLIKSPPVKEWARDHDIPALQPHSLKKTPHAESASLLSLSENAQVKNDEELALLQNSEWDLFIVAAYGKIIPPHLIDLPSRGTLNVHPSLLPRFRGASPIESQILADERETGVSIMRIDEEVDHGPIVAQASITPEEWPLDAPTLSSLLAYEGGVLLAEAIPGWLAGSITATPQDHANATFTKKIKKEDGHLSLSEDGYQNYLKYLAFNPWPGVFFFADGKRIKITDATYQDGSFVPLTVVPEGKKQIPYERWRVSARH